MNRNGILAIVDDKGRESSAPVGSACWPAS